MKLKIIITSFVFLLLASQVSATEPIISNIQVGEIKNGQATITWNTNDSTTSTIRFGLDETLPHYISNSVAKKTHEAILTNLQKNTDYYYRIYAYNSAGEETQSFLQYLSTKDMIDTEAPKVLSHEIIQVIYNGAAIEWTTNEPSKATAYYGLDINNLKDNEKSSKLTTRHFIILEDLGIDDHYYINIVSEDEDGNESSYRLEINTPSSGNGETLSIKNISSEDTSTAMIQREYASITWETNFVAETDLYYGTEKDRLREKVEASSEPKLSHKAELTELLPDTTYYFYIKAHDSFDNQSAESDIRSFKTKNLSADYMANLYHDGDFIREGRSGTIYRIQGDKRIPYHDSSFDDLGFDKDDVIEVSEEHLQYYRETKGYYGTLTDGDVVKLDDKPAVYLIQDDKKKPIANWAILSYLGYGAKDIKIVERSNLNDYRTGDLITHSNQVISKTKIKNNSVVKAPGDPAVYLIRNNTKWRFMNPQAFLKRFHWNDIKEVSANDLNDYEEAGALFE